MDLLDVLAIAGIDRSICLYLPLKDVARLACSCQGLKKSVSLTWILDREWLLRLKCPPEFKTIILNHKGPMNVVAWSRTVRQPTLGSTVWEALKPLFTGTPMKRCYGLEFKITLLPSSNSCHSMTPPHEFQCQLQFSNQVLCHVNDITIYESGYYSATNFSQRPDMLHCLCEFHCFGKETTRKFHFITGHYCEGGYYCNACLELNGFVKMRKIQTGDPGAMAIWNGQACKLV
mmetsp:Transcript_32931/g.49720  ORF Transcript_32931/g.49720 Transcript_32931/m.49720 type:complete len:232 (-) Transcript_32931:2313-3008(-)